MSYIPISDESQSQEERVQELLASLGHAPGYADVLRVGSKILAICSHASEAWRAKRVRITLASSFTADPIAPFLAVECVRAGLCPHIQIDGYNLFHQHLLDRTSPLYQFHPDIIFLSAELGSITSLLEQSDRTEFEVSGDAILQLQELIEAAKRNSQALLVIHNFALPADFPFSLLPDSQAVIYTEVNKWLTETFADDHRVRVPNVDRLASFHGKCRTRDPKLHYLGSIEVSTSFLPLLVKSYMAYLQAMLGLSRKCLVLDLDDTIWGGVIGEDGIEGIRIAQSGSGSEYYDFQKAILTLRKRGVILAANSKNNMADVARVFENHPDMILRQEHFAAMRVNWEDKASNLRSIAEELRLSLESMVFADDSPVECAWVREAVPEVLVVELPSDASLYARTIQGLIAFEVLAVTDEDRRRGDLYASEQARRQAYEQSGGLDNFLRGLQMVLTIRLAQSEDVSRIGQLTRKTSQFNMRTRRYSDAEIAQFSQASNMLVYCLKVRDRFGDSGLVGVMILVEVEKAWRIDTFLMSCRVLGRRIEHAFATEVLADLRARGVRYLEAEFIPTKKNGPASDFYLEFGFLPSSNMSGAQSWNLELQAWNPERFEFHVVEGSNCNVERNVS